MGSKDSKDKPDLIKKIEKLAANDAKYGRGSKSNPNNKPNGGK